MWFWPSMEINYAGVLCPAVADIMEFQRQHVRGPKIIGEIDRPLPEPLHIVFTAPIIKDFSMSGRDQCNWIYAAFWPVRISGNRYLITGFAVPSEMVDVSQNHRVQPGDDQWAFDLKRLDQASVSRRIGSQQNLDDRFLEFSATIRKQYECEIRR